MLERYVRRLFFFFLEREGFEFFFSYKYEKNWKIKPEMWYLDK